MWFVNWLVKLIMEFLFGKAQEGVEFVVDKKKSHTATEENATELQEEMKKDEATDDAIEGRSEDLLNGNRR